VSKYEILDVTRQSMSPSKNNNFGRHGRLRPKQIIRKRVREPKYFKQCRAYLKSKVGQNFNDVWADICNADYREQPFKKILRNDIDIYVNFEIGLDQDGELFTYYGRIPLGIYIDPKNNQLCYRAPKKYKKAPNNRIMEIDGVKFVEYEGLYYSVKLIDFIKEWWYSKLFTLYDVLFKRAMSYDELLSFYGAPLICVSKTQATSKQLKEIKRRINNG